MQQCVNYYSTIIYPILNYNYIGKIPISQHNVIQNHWYHDDVIKWKHFSRYRPFVRGIHQSIEFPAQRPVMRSFDVFLDLRPNKRLSKQPWGWWFETPSWSLWRQCNGEIIKNMLKFGELKSSELRHESFSWRIYKKGFDRCVTKFMWHIIYLNMTTWFIQMHIRGLPPR